MFPAIGIMLVAGLALCGAVLAIAWFPIARRAQTPK